MSRNDRQNCLVFAAAFALTAGLSVLWLAVGEIDDERIRVSLRYSAQLAFALYLVVLITRPLQQLLRKDWTAVLLRNRRLVGISFAAVMSAHLGLIIYRYSSQPDLDFSLPAIGAGAYAIFYLMLITSFDRSLDDLSDPDYLKYGIPFAIAILIRATAWLQSRRQGS